MFKWQRWVAAEQNGHDYIIAEIFGDYQVSNLNPKRKMKRLPIGIQTFSELVDPAENYVYVDKTEVLHTLVTEGKYYFLSRPRRFGKSVMLSTLYELFSGNRDLFSGLHIEDKWEWSKQYPVIRIRFGSGNFSSEEKFDRQIQVLMDESVDLIAFLFDVEVNGKFYRRHMVDIPRIKFFI